MSEYPKMLHIWKKRISFQKQLKAFVRGRCTIHKAKQIGPALHIIVLLEMQTPSIQSLRKVFMEAIFVLH